MDAIKYVKNAREIAMKYIEELEKPLYSDESVHIKLVEFAGRTLSSRSIHSGNGDRDVDLSIGVTKEGWVKYITEVETTTPYTPFKMELVSRTQMSDKDVEDYLNGKDCKIGEIYRFIKKYNELASLYPKELNSISGLTETIM